MRKELIKVLCLSTTSFSIILRAILTCLHVYCTEGRETVISLRKPIDDKGMHFTFPEVEMWLNAVFALIVFIFPIFYFLNYVFSIIMVFIAYFIFDMRLFLLIRK